MTAAAKTEPRGLHAKLAEVMAEADRIPKAGVAPAAMGGFKFVQVGDAADAIRKALGSRGVSMLPSAIDVVGEAEHATSSGKTMTTLTVRTTWTLVDGETGQTATIQSLGAGADMGDKAAPKAQSNAMKYALLMGFLLSTGDDPEQTDTSDRRARSSGTGRPVAASSGDGATAPPQEETLTSIGPRLFVGKVAAGDGLHSNAMWRETPDGWHVGFRLEGQGVSVPQVCAEGAIGVALHLLGELPIGAEFEVQGEAFAVDFPGRRRTQRLIASRIKGPDFEIPAPGGTAPAAPVEEDLSVLAW